MVSILTTATLDTYTSIELITTLTTLTTWHLTLKVDL
jgi:hypothetical protein